MQACGVCYSDCYPVLGKLGAKFPVIPGHEVVGKVSLNHTSTAGCGVEVPLPRSHRVLLMVRDDPEWSRIRVLIFTV